MSAQDFAIVIGINRYDNASVNLSSPVNDAKAVARWLVDPDGGGLPVPASWRQGDFVEPVATTDLPAVLERQSQGNPVDQCILLLSEVGSRSEVGQREITRALVVAANFASANTGRRIYFYFSGHGVSRVANDVLMCHSEWSSFTPHANYSSSYLHSDYLNRCGGDFDEVVMWLDCCRNVSMLTVPSNSPLACYKDSNPDQKRVITYAAGHDSFAYQADEISETGLSVFTEVLLEALRHAECQETGCVTWQSVSNYLATVLPSRAQQYSLRHQHPQVEVPIYGTPDFVLAAQVLPVSLQLMFSGFKGSACIMTGEKTVAQLDLEGDVTFTLSLPPRIYKLHLPNGHIELLDVNGATKGFRYEA